MILSEVMTRNGTGSSTSHNRVITVSGTGSHTRKWYTGSHDRKWHRKSWSEVAPEVMTGCGTRSHDRKEHQKSWPEVALEVMTGWLYIRIAIYRQTDRQTECFTTGNIPCFTIETVRLLSSLQHSISWSHPGSVSTQAEPRTQKLEVRSQDEEINQGDSTLLIYM